MKKENDLTQAPTDNNDNGGSYSGSVGESTKRDNKISLPTKIAIGVGVVLVITVLIAILYYITQ